MEANFNLNLIDIINLTYGDPINSISLTMNKILFGTMMGKFCIYDIRNKSIEILCELSNEQISGTSFSKDFKYFYISIGDEKIIQFDSNNIEKYKTFNGYEQEEVHIDRCESCFCLLNENQFLMLFLIEPQKNEDPIQNYNCEYTLKIIKDNSYIEEKNGNINMSNYIVPFDFKNNTFVFLEHLSKEKRQVKIYNFEKEQFDNIFEIDQLFGHISFVKLINNGFIVVKKYNIISIRDDSFQIINQFENDSEIISIDYYYDDNQVLHILFIDTDYDLIDGYFNSNKEFIITTSINLPLKDDINEILRKKGLFNMDFPYYVKGNTKYIIVTCDYACLVFQKQI